MSNIPTTQKRVSEFLTRERTFTGASFDSIVPFFKKIRTSYIPELVTVLVLVILAGVYATSFASVATRQPVLFQGRLTDTSYVPVADGAYPMKFKIWDAATGGTCVWATGADQTTGINNCGTATGITPAVSVSRGVFTVRLGDNTAGTDNNPPIDISFEGTTNYFLEIIVGPIAGSPTDTLAPRIRLGATPYSYNADLFDGFDSNQLVRSDLVPTGTGVLLGTGIINPASATANFTLLGLAVAGTEKFRVDAEGDTDIAGKLRVGSIVAPVATADIGGNLRTTGKATTVLTGSIDPTASTSVTGVTTLFTTELVVGDRITVSGETRTVTSIASDTALTVDTAFTDTADDAAVDVLYALATLRDAASVLSMVANDQGRVGIGVVAPTTSLDVAGLTINTDSDLAIAGAKMSATFTKNTTDTRTFSVLKTTPTFNFGGSNTTTTVNIFEIDSTNTAVTGLTTNLIKASYGGAEEFKVDSAGNMSLAGNITPAVDNTKDLGTSALRWKTLHVGPGSVVVHNDATDTAKVTVGFSGSTAQVVSDATTPIKITTGTNTGLNIDTSGNVGIGVASSLGSLLHVAGNAQLGTASTTTGQLKLYNSASANATTFQANASASAITYTWPANAGSSGQVLSTNGSGVLSWTTPAVGSSGTDHATTVDWFDDFIGLGAPVTQNVGTGTPPSISEMDWALMGAGSGFAIAQTGETSAIGSLRLQTGGATNDYTSLNGGWNGNNDVLLGNQGNYTITTRFRLDSTTDNSRVHVGLSNYADPETVTTSGVYFEIDTTIDTNWRGVTNTAGTTSTTSTIAADTSFHKFEIIMNSGGTSVEFKIDGVSMGSLTTNIPSSAVAPTIGIHALSATAKKLVVDYYGLRITGLTR